MGSCTSNFRPENPGSKFMKIVVVLILVLILASLGSALVFLVRDEGKSKRTVNALTVRIGLSVALFLFLMFGYYMGWFVPNRI